MATLMSEQTDTVRAGGLGKGPTESAGGGRGAWLWRRPLLFLLIAAGAALAGLAVWALGSDIRNPEPTLVYYTVRRADLPIKVTESVVVPSMGLSPLFKRREG